MRVSGSPHGAHAYNVEPLDEEEATLRLPGLAAEDDRLVEASRDAVEELHRARLAAEDDIRRPLSAGEEG